VSEPVVANDHEAWKAYWSERGQPWRTEPEINAARQGQLSVALGVTVDIEGAVFPFKGMRLSRADVEWLLAENAQVAESKHDLSLAKAGSEPSPEERGLDLRGADLSQVNLSGLPLMRLRGGLSIEESRHTTIEQNKAVAVNLTQADLSRAQLQGGLLGWATLDKAVLVEAHLEGADLGKASLRQAILAGAHLEGVDLTKAHLEGATLLEAHLENAYLLGTFLEGANLLEAHCEGARLGGAQLEGANLQDVHFEGKAVPRDDLARLRRWLPHFPARLRAADLRGMYLDKRTNLTGARLGDERLGFVTLADIHWGDVNLTVVDWKQVKWLGDEHIAPPLRNKTEDLPQESAKPAEETANSSSRGSKETRTMRAIDRMLRAQEVNDAVISYVTSSPTLMERMRRRQVREEEQEKVRLKNLATWRDTAALRANRQLAVILRSQGLNEDADRFAYRAHLIQRRMLLRNGPRSIGPFLFSCFLDVLAGYGYKPGRTLVAYLSIILGFGLLYFLSGQDVEPHYSPLYALLVSIISFHGRGFFPSGFLPTMPMVVLGACEAIIGVTIEISFIATFTQRYFGK